MEQYKRRSWRFGKRRFTVVLIAFFAVFTLALGEISYAKPPWKIGRRSLTKQVANTWAQPGVRQLVVNDEKAMKGLVKMARLAAKPGQTNRDIIGAIGKSIVKLEKEIGPAQTKRLLRDFDDLAEWARRNPAVRGKELGELVRDFTKTKGRSNKFTGAWYEIHLAAKYVKSPPPRLVRLQPKVGGDNLLFRDFVVKNPDGTLSYVEAKNWRLTATKTGRKRLRKQVRSHFRRLRQPPPEQVLNIPPGKKLIFQFNARQNGHGPAATFSGDIDPTWKKAIRDEVRRTLRKPPPNGYGFSKDNARIWVQQNLRIKQLSYH